MKRSGFLSLFSFVVVLLTLSACTVAEEYDVFHRDGKTYITSLRVHTGVPDGEDLGTRTFFDTRDGYYGIVYWEDGKTPFWPEDGEGTFGPDHLYFFNYNENNWEYAKNISDYFCTRLYEGEHHYPPKDNTIWQWATFNLQLRTPALQVWEKDGDPTYFGYYCSAIKDKRPGENVKYDVELHDQDGQGDAVLRDFLRSSDVLWLEFPTAAEMDPVTQPTHLFRLIDQDYQDVYFSHIFSLVEVDIKRNDDACTKWKSSPGGGGGGGTGGWGSSSRRAGVGSQNGMNAGDDSLHFNRLTEPYLGNLSYLPMGNVDLIGSSSISFLKTYSFDQHGQWFCSSKHSTVRCTRVDSIKNNLSLLYPGHEENTVKYYFLVYSFDPISSLTVEIITPRYDPNGYVSQETPFQRRIEFPLEDGFMFKPGKYYKLALDLGLPDSVSTATDAAGNPTFDKNGKRRFLDRDWITSDYHLLAPSAEMKNMRWGIKFEADGTIKYKEQNEYP